MGKGGYEQVPGTGAGAYQTVDPSGFTQQAGQNIFGQPWENAMRQAGMAEQAWLGGGPQSMTGQFLQDYGQLSGAITDQQAPLRQALQQQARLGTERAVTDIGSQMANLGALESSGMARLAGEAAGQEAAKAQVAQEQALMGALNPLAQQAMGGRQAALSQMMGQPGQMLGIQAGFGSPTYAAPQYVQTPSGWDRAMQGIGAVGSLAGGIGGLMNPFFAKGGIWRR